MNPQMIFVLLHQPIILGQPVPCMQDNTLPIEIDSISLHVFIPASSLKNDVFQFNLARALPNNTFKYIRTYI